MDLAILARAVRVGAELCACAIHGALCWLVGALLRRPRAWRWRAVGAGLTRTCRRLGPSFVKIGQLVSCRADVLPPALLAPLGALLDDTPPMPGRLVRPWCATLLGEPLASVFASFDDTPLATGSIAQVHRATLRESGQPVAVKIQRPDIERTMAADLGLLRRLVRWQTRVNPAARDLPLVEMVEQVAVALMTQLDFEVERQHDELFRRELEPQLPLRLPRIDRRWSNRRLLVMELFEGPRRIDDGALPARAFEAASDVLVHAVYHMVFGLGVIHCDLHPANVLCDRDGALFLVDTGFVGLMPIRDRRSFARFFYGMVTNDGPACARILRATALRVRPGFDEEGFAGDVSQVVAATAGRTAGSFSVARFVGSMFEVQRRHGLCGSPGFTMAIVALLVVEGVVRARRPHLDFQTRAVRHLLPHLFADPTRASVADPRPEASP